MSRSLALLVLVVAGGASAQPAEPLEWYLPAAVQDTVSAFVATLPEAELGSPYLIWRGRRDGAYEFVVATGEPLRCDSLLLARTNRVTAIGGAVYKVTLDDDDAFAVHGWTEVPFASGPQRRPTVCDTLRHWLFVVRFDAGRVVSAAREQ